MRHSHVGRAGLSLLALATLFLFVSPASAQYFGRNKVQYRSFKYRSPEDGPFRRLLLLARTAGGRGRRAEGRAVVRTAVEGVPAQAQWDPAAHHLPESPRLRADQRGVGGDRRRDGRLHRRLPSADRDAARRLAGRVGSCRRPRTGARLPVRHHDRGERAGGHPRRHQAAAVVHRGHGRVPHAWPRRPEHVDVGPRRGGHREAAEAQGPRGPASTSRTAGARPSGPT